MTGCPSLNELQQLLADQLSGPQEDALQSHVEECTACQQALEQLTGRAPFGKRPGSETEERPGVRVALSAAALFLADGTGADFLRRLEQAVKAVKDPNNDAGSTVTSADQSSTSSSLLDGLKSRDPEAWRRLAYLYGPVVYRWCRRKGLPAEDCDDVVQEVFLTVAARVGDFRRQGARDTFRGWLWTITRNKLGDWLRRQKVQARAMGGPGTPEGFAEAAPDQGEESLSEPEAQEMGLLARRALDLIRTEFEEPSWQAFWRVVVEGQSPADVAVQLSITRNAVYIARCRILRRLREVLAEE